MQHSILPEHIAIVMDGNGRWAKKRFLPHIAGHRAGVTAARRTIKYCAKRGIKVLSLFAFSSENWQRPTHEVNYLMDLFLTSLEHEINVLLENNIQLKFIGDRSRFSEKLVLKIQEVEAKTKANNGMTLVVAADYGGRWDIYQAAKRLVDDVLCGELPSAAITAEHITERLSFADLPDPDLFIRTSGEVRISNFMLWQLAYSELYFTDKLWPDFDEQALDLALECFAARERRYGKRLEQEKEGSDVC